MVSVTGEFIRNPGNYIVKLGARRRDHRSLRRHHRRRRGAENGRPHDGRSIKDTNVPIIKGSNGIIAIAADHTEEKECVECGRCMDVCPMELAPLDIYKYAQLGDAETLLKLNVMDCFSCKCCEYIYLPRFLWFPESTLPRAWSCPC
ncbi:MAG: 4Fe-4S dicluster domain-containing protein [Oscillospiraceae bacterium]